MTTYSAVRRIFNNRDETITDVTAAFYELEPFESIFHALRWRQVKRRLPICLKKTMNNRFLLPNLIYVGYAVGLLIIDFDEHLIMSLSNKTEKDSMCSVSNKTKVRSSVMDQPMENEPFINQCYIGLIREYETSDGVDRSFVHSRIVDSQHHWWLALHMGVESPVISRRYNDT